ncbi:unnamed protein product [Acanthoscelides obtectus]|uniref:Uncharacterized protein n=1 Tax=Acanthoscelides obtectus TaxID=200917 RepID=A0A9P0JK82_ACAOB|nr:unnamed protein product [Acanthoscelides obtectus]CAK1625021.1 hypothetical protein AOBTE_LOCUS2898 [Acanthoscelides obtectus]
MSDNSTNFPPQTYSSSFCLNALAEDEKSALNAAKCSNQKVEDGAENAPIFDCFISTVSFFGEAIIYYKFLINNELN